MTRKTKILMKPRNDLTSDQAIALINNTWGSGHMVEPELLMSLVTTIVSARDNKDVKAQHWLFLNNWKPQQMVN